MSLSLRSASVIIRDLLCYPNEDPLGIFFSVPPPELPHFLSKKIPLEGLVNQYVPIVDVTPA